MSLACYVTAVTLQPGAELPATDVVLGTKNPAIVLYLSYPFILTLAPAR